MPLPPALGRGSASAINRANRRSLSLSEPASHPSLQPSSLTTTSSTITASCKVGRSKPLAPSEDMPRLHWGCNDRLTRLGWQREREVPGWARLLPQASTSRAAPRGTSLLPSIPYHFTQQPGDQLAQHSHSEDGRLGSQAEGGGERGGKEDTQFPEGCLGGERRRGSPNRDLFLGPLKLAPVPSVVLQHLPGRTKWAGECSSELPGEECPALQPLPSPCSLGCPNPHSISRLPGGPPVARLPPSTQQSAQPSCTTS